jgi:hypothetical protein
MTYGEINVRFFSIYRGEHFGGIELSNVKMKQGDVARNRFRMFHGDRSRSSSAESLAFMRRRRDKKMSRPAPRFVARGNRLVFGAEVP